ncbi:MAG: carbohydrate porin [Syntrophales bacterium]|jgi:porin
MIRSKCNFNMVACVIVLSAVLSILVFFTQSQADEPTAGKLYSGDIWTRSTPTGDWGGARNDLANKGVSFDMSLTQIVQSVIAGGIHTGSEYGGRGNLTLNLDTQKLGLWPGGFFMAEVEGNFGNSVNTDIGALMTANSSQLYPMPTGDQLNIPAVVFTQFLSPYFGVFLGKLDTTGGDANEFAHGKGDQQFFNLAFNIDPVAGLAVPYSTLGAGLVILPTKNINSAVIQIMAVDADGKANSDGFDTLFKGNMSYAAEGRIKTDFFGFTGHQLAGAVYSVKDYSSLDQSLRFIIINRTLEQKDGTWAFYYNFDQYLYEVKKGGGQGIGIFGRFGVSDGNPNPLQYFYSLGIGGKGIIPDRPLDSFGIGYYYIAIGHPTFTGPLAAHEFLRDEQGCEIYYNIALTPWMRLTPDLQIVRSAQKQFMTGGGILTPNLEDINTATILGLRLQLIF